MGSQQFCLKWNNHQLNMLTVFDQLLQNEAFVDVTIACEGLSLKAHKMVLSACSPYFQNLFMDNPCKHPIVILKDIRYDEMKAIIDFMYKGEVNVSQDQLSALLKTAEALKVKGLAEVTGQGPHGQVQQGSSQSSSAASVLFETVGSRHSPPAKRKKRPPASAAVSIGSPVSPGNSNTSHSTSSHRALSPPHPVVQSAVSLAPVPSAGSVTASGMCSGDEDQSPLVGLNRSRNMEGVPGSSKDGLSNVKEEKIEIEEPPDDVEDLIMEATPEHIEIEPSTADTSTPFNIVRNRRGGYKLMHDGYQYVLEREQANKTIWRCAAYRSSRKCMAILHTTDTEVVKSRPHNHRPGSPKPAGKSTPSRDYGESPRDSADESILPNPDMDFVSQHLPSMLALKRLGEQALQDQQCADGYSDDFPSLLGSVGSYPLNFR